MKTKLSTLTKSALLIGAVICCFSCADSKDFEINGKNITIEPYGWFDLEAKHDSINYKVNTGNVVWSIILSGTIIAPVLLTGNSLWEPVSKK